MVSLGFVKIQNVLRILKQKFITAYIALQNAGE